MSCWWLEKLPSHSKGGGLCHSSCLEGYFYSEALLSSTLKWILLLWTSVNANVHWTTWRRNCCHSYTQMGGARHREAGWPPKVKQIGRVNGLWDSYLSNSSFFPPFLTLAFLVIKPHCLPPPSKAKSYVQTHAHFRMLCRKDLDVLKGKEECEDM